MAPVIPLKEGLATLEYRSVLEMIALLKDQYILKYGREPRFLIIGGNPKRKLIHELNEGMGLHPPVRLASIQGMHFVQVQRDALEVGE